MAISLSKGGNISLSTLPSILDPRVISAKSPSVWDGIRSPTDGQRPIWMQLYFLYNSSAKFVRTMILYFTISQSKDGSVVHQGDNRTGEG